MADVLHSTKFPEWKLHIFLTSIISQNFAILCYCLCQL